MFGSSVALTCTGPPCGRSGWYIAVVSPVPSWTMPCASITGSRCLREEGGRAWGASTVQRHARLCTNGLVAGGFLVGIAASATHEVGQVVVGWSLGSWFLRSKSAAGGQDVVSSGIVCYLEDRNETR